MLELLRSIYLQINYLYQKYFKHFTILPHLAKNDSFTYNFLKLFVFLDEKSVRQCEVYRFKAPLFIFLSVSIDLFSKL